MHTERAGLSHWVGGAHARRRKACANASRRVELLRSDVQAGRRDKDLAEKIQQSGKERQHRRDEQESHRNRGIEVQESAREENRDHRAHQQRY